MPCRGGVRLHSPTIPLRRVVTATTSHTVSVNMPAGRLADFTFAPATGTLTVSFKDASPGTITAWLWDFGDGTADSTETTIQNPSHTYSARGTYNVTLTVTDDADLTASITRSVTVDDPRRPPAWCRTSITPTLQTSVPGWCGRRRALPAP